jgi:hypothetical protein
MRPVLRAEDAFAMPEFSTQAMLHAWNAIKINWFP